MLQHGLRQQPIWQLAFNHAAWQPDALGSGSPLLLAVRCPAWIIVLRVSRTASGCAYIQELSCVSPAIPVAAVPCIHPVHVKCIVAKMPWPSWSALFHSILRESGWHGYAWMSSCCTSARQDVS